MRICIIPRCGRKHQANGYCEKHYKQIKKFGKIKQRTTQDPNEIIIENDICRMKLYNKKCEEIAETIFDLKYKDLIEQYKWHLHSSDGYVSSAWYDENGIQHKILLHQTIVYLSGKQIKNGEEIDHEDRNTLNNLENNLRVITDSQNQYNSKIRNDNISGSKGVSWNKTMKKWQAQIMVNNKHIHLGYFSIIADASKAYNAAAIKYHGEFAVLNKV